LWIANLKSEIEIPQSEIINLMNTLENNILVLIADSQFLITESLKLILQNDSRFYVSNVVIEKKELASELAGQNISLLITDPSFIDLSGLSELKEIISEYPHLKILVTTNGLTKAEMLELNNLGINDIILKTIGKEEFFEALNATLKGRKYYSNELLELLFETNDKKGSGDETGQLTISEMDIVRLIAEGLTTKEIALRKYISIHTVITHRKNIFRKLGVSSVSELIMYAIKSGWINLIEYHI
jgi:DNA-binding NarL/FixJ family response regulator